MTTVPIAYKRGFVTDPAIEFEKLWNELEWERRGSTPRREYYCNGAGVPYTYGSGAGVREYRRRRARRLLPQRLRRRS
jgi:hypothetical protein